MRLKLSILLCALAGLVLCATPALAARGHAYGSTFGNGRLSEPEGVAVNETTGDVYVVDKGNDRVDEFEAGGTFVRAWGWGVNEASPKKELQECTTTTGCLPGEAGTGAGQFEKPEGIAVDNSTASTDPSRGDVYVVDSGHKVVDKFSATGTPINEITEVPAGATGCQIAHVSPGVFTSIQGVAVGMNGELWIAATLGQQGDAAVYGFSDGEVNRCTGVRETTTPELSGSLGYQWPGLAVDGEGALYVRHDRLDPGTDVISKFNAKSELVDERVGPAPPGEPLEEERGLATELVSNDVYIDAYGYVERRSPGGVLIEELHAPGLTAGSGVAVNSTTGQVYVADSSGDAVDVFPLEPPGPPRVAGESVSKVTGDSAVFAADVEPRSLAGEKTSTTYSFEYGPCASPSTCATTSVYGKEVSGLVPPSFEVDAVSVSVQGLQAHTAYHFRVVAENAHDPKNPVEGKAQAFITQGAGGELVLPDGRAWELVSPADKHGASIEPITEQGLVQAAAGGGAFTYLASVPTESEPQGFTNAVQVLSTRGPGGWSSRDISVPDAAATGKSVGVGEEYLFFSEDLSAAVLAPFGPFTALSPAASESTAYLRDDTDGTYRPLVTGCPSEASGEACAPSIEEQADVPPGTVFGGEVNGQCAEGLVACGPKARAATPDLSAVVLETTALLTEEAREVAEREHATAVPRLYEWEAGHLTYVGISANESVEALSSNGSYVVFEGSSEGKTGLLVRDTASRETVQLDAAEASCHGCTSGGGLYQAANADASKTFFTDKNALTGSSGGATSEGEGDLYECEIVAGPGGLKCDLTDLTPKGGGGEAALVQGVFGVSKDGDWVYFVADGVLASGGVQGSCNKSGALTGECNLYAEHYNGSGWEAPRLVAVVSGEDAPDWSVPPRGSLSKHTARVSPDGGWLAFMSQRSLTGYDNDDANSGKPDEEVYLYHAVGEGSLVCASCNPTGARPEGMEYAHMQLAIDGRAWPSDTWIAGNVPGWTPLKLGVASYQSRYLSDDGRLFFNSSDQLVPQDGNRQEDVYEYEPPGIGSCTTESATYGEQAAGCVGLISSGSSGAESAFLDASEGGGEVFFLTAAKLASQDYDSSVDVYDARECSPSSPCVATPAVSPGPCENAEACRAASTPPSEVFGAPPSATFNGLGNITPEPAVKPATKAKAKPLTRAQKLAAALKVCKKEKQGAKRKRCETTARKKDGPLKKKTAKRKA